MISPLLNTLTFFPHVFATEAGPFATFAFRCDCGRILPSADSLGPGFHVCECPDCATLFPFHIYAQATHTALQP